GKGQSRVPSHGARAPPRRQQGGALGRRPSEDQQPRLSRVRDVPELSRVEGVRVMLTLDGMVGAAFVTARGQLMNQSPEDTLTPVLVGYTDHDAFVVPLIGPPLEAFAVTLPGLLRHQNAVGYVVVSEAWAAMVPEDQIATAP